MQGLYVQIGVPRVWQDPMQIGVRTLGRGLRALGRGLRGGARRRIRNAQALGYSTAGYSMNSLSAHGPVWHMHSRSVLNNDTSGIVHEVRCTTVYASY
jgi:hypothetical protein